MRRSEVKEYPSEVHLREHSECGVPTTWWSTAEAKAAGHPVTEIILHTKFEMGIRVCAKCGAAVPSQAIGKGEKKTWRISPEQITCGPG